MNSKLLNNRYSPYLNSTAKRGFGIIACLILLALTETIHFILRAESKLFYEKNRLYTYNPSLPE